MQPSEPSLLLQFLWAWAIFVAVPGLPLFGPFFALNAFHKAASWWTRFARKPTSLGKLVMALWHTASLGLVTLATAWILISSFSFMATWFEPSAYLPFLSLLTVFLLLGCCYGWSKTRREETWELEER